MRALTTLCVLFAPLLARAEDDVSQCTDAYSDCHETCSLRFGMVTRDSERLKLVKCIDKCKRTEADCRDRFFETKNNALDDNAIKKGRERDDDLREDNRKTAIVPDEKPARRPREEESPKRTSTRADELSAKEKDKEKKEPTSSSEDARYNLKFEEQKKEEPAKREEPKQQAALDSDVRKEDTESKPAPAPAAEKKRASPSSSSDDAPKKKKDRALDEWDPEAL